jgi:hypothetical protein
MGAIQIFISYRLHQRFNCGVKGVNYVMEYETSVRLPFNKNQCGFVD